MRCAVRDTSSRSWSNARESRDNDSCEKVIVVLLNLMRPDMTVCGTLVICTGGLQTSNTGEQALTYASNSFIITDGGDGSPARGTSIAELAGRP